MSAPCALPTNAENLALDTSAAIASVTSDNPVQAGLIERLRGAHLGLAGHARFETYSVLTRMPPPRRLSPEAAARLIQVNFPEVLPFDGRGTVAFLDALVERSITGGAVYDALVAAAALHHDRTLISTDQRAQATYRAMGVRFELLR
ncbi:MAG: PIN domain-containing protein [Actinobacteria bacterium]|nr:PIN domain-containing protein [Actinomycetota bacterium]